MRVTRSAQKHKVDPQDTIHAWEHAWFKIARDYNGTEQIFAIGPARNGDPLEIVAVDAEQPSRIIHSMPCREKFYRMIPRDKR